MKGSIIAAPIAGLIVFSFATAASAQLGTGKTRPSRTMSTSTESSATCRVKSVAASGFDCGTHTFEVTSSTAYSGTSLSQLAGTRVTVTYHMSGRTAVADSVTAN